MVASFSYNAGTNTVTVTGSTTTLMDDWVAADTANGWGKISKLGTTLYLVSCKIVGGDGATLTNVSDKNKQIVWADGIVTGDNQLLISVVSNATLTFGVISDATAKTSANGCLLICLEADNYLNFIINSGTGVIYLYSCQIQSPTAEAFVWATRAWNCNFVDKAYPYDVNSLTGDFDSMVVGRTIRHPILTSTFNNVLMKPTGGTYCNVIWLQSSASILKNVIVPSISGYTLYIRVDNTNAADHYFINVNKGNAVFYWAGTNTGKAYWQYEFDLQVVDSQNDGTPLQGARYRIYDKNGNELTKTGSGYTSVPNVVLTAPPAGGTQATAHAVLEPNGQGAISNFVIDNPGSGYVNPPTVTVDPPASGATATALATLATGSVSTITPTTYTDANGNIPTRCVTRGYYDAAHGDTLQDYAPLLIVITKDGYQNYRAPMNIALKTGYQVSMNRVVPVLVSAGGKLQVDLMPSNPVNMMLLDVG
jgi:hypothetical protein